MTEQMVALRARADAVIAEIRSRQDFDWAPDRLVRDLAAAPLVEEEQVTAETSNVLKLSVNQRSALVAASRGYRPSETAEMLGVSEVAIVDRLKQARMKLSAHTTTEAACEAIRRGLIP